MIEDLGKIITAIYINNFSNNIFLTDRAKSENKLSGRVNYDRIVTTEFENLTWWEVGEGGGGRNCRSLVVVIGSICPLNGGA